MNQRVKALMWTARIFALIVIAFGLLFYFAYGNPLPFINPDYTLWDNIWLSIFPLMFIGLALGWRHEKIGGYLVTVPIAIGLLAGIFMQGELVLHMLAPFLIGVLYLIVGYKKKAG